MAQGYNRKTSPKVIGSLVQRKNSHSKTARNGYVVDRKRAGKGYRHILKKAEVAVDSSGKTAEVLHASS